jgi:tripartite-type tricarboxylate transporter receptor subunit TctC
VDKIAKDIARVLAAPELRAWLEEHGTDRMSMTPPEFARFVLEESESTKRIVKAAGVKP